MIALEGNFAYSFLLGVMAAVNPCGFVLLPTYLVYYLGTELGRGDEPRVATLRRGLSVGATVSGGFLALFIVVGIVSRAFTTVIQDNAKYAALVIGLALVVAGVAMLRGWKPPVMQPDISLERNRSTGNMFLFGIVYAVASLGCTIGFLTSVILGSVGRHGYVSGVLSVVLYGLGMAMLVTALTVTLAFARMGLVTAVRRGFAWFDKVSAMFVLLTGAYLSWYWWGAITNRASDSVVGRVERLQSRTAEALQNIGAWWLAVACAAVVGTAVFMARRPSRGNV